jgi:hypothetical protein
VGTIAGVKLVEVLVASAIAFVLAAVLVTATHATILGAAHLDARLAARSATDRLAERLESDAASAWSIFVPAADVLGNANGDGHELDFVTEDASHRTYWWAYNFNSSAQRVSSYSYAPGGASIAGDTFDGIATFAAKTFAVSELANPSSAIYDPLFAGTNAAPVSFDYGWNAQAVGGNRLTRVHVTATGVDRTLLLTSATAPTHFTVVIEYTPAPTATP